MGRGAGFIAVNTGVACGATYVITSEVPYDLDVIAKKMLESRKTGKQHFIIIVSEGVGHSDEIARTLQEKTGIEARTTIMQLICSHRVLETELSECKIIKSWIMTFRKLFP